MTAFRYSSVFACSPEELFEFHMDVANLAAISPPWPPMRVAAAGRAAPGERQTMVIGRAPLAVTWVARIERVVEGKLLEDTQESGPFQRWRHQHRVAPEGGGSRLTDVVSFRLLPTALGEFVEYWTVRPLLLGMFAARHRRTRALLAHRNN